MSPLRFLPPVVALFVGACAAPARAPYEAAQAERKAYVECAVRTAYLAPRAHASLADLLARAAMAACEPQRLALLAGLARDLGTDPDPARAAARHLREVDTALAERLALRLYQRAVNDLTSGAGADV